MTTSATKGISTRAGPVVSQEGPSGVCGTCWHMPGADSDRTLSHDQHRSKGAQPYALVAGLLPCRAAGCLWNVLVQRGGKDASDRCICSGGEYLRRGDRPNWTGRP
jgi:hypothetical protein